MTVAEFREWLLDERTTTEMIRHASRGLTSEIVAGVCTVSYTHLPRIQIVEKEVIYRSLIYFTPLKSSTEIDAEAVKKIVRDEYKAAGMTPEDVKTGAVIITGETARKQNRCV